RPAPYARAESLYLENNSIINVTINYFKAEHNGKNENVLEIKRLSGSKTAILEQEYNDFWKNNETKENFHKLLYNEVTKIFMENAKNSFSGKTLRDLAMGNPILSVDELENLYERIDTTCQSKSDLALFRKKMKTLKEYKIGDSFISFSLPDQNSKIININDYRGRYLLVDFWASWCRPCRQQNRELVKLYYKLNKSKFDIISVSIYKKEENWKTAIKKDSLTWTNVIDTTEETADKLGIIEIPFSYLLDLDGKIIGINLSDNEIEKIVNTDN
ncbi:MAG: TlpA family protein disulfide reductase, partial [Flavobacteriaceae bacterium]|nr:TlpA family protein disulfide reductase [Flavobacteriaceae bacterium]